MRLLKYGMPHQSHSWQSRQALPLHPALPIITSTLPRARSAGDAALDRGG